MCLEPSGQPRGLKKKEKDRQRSLDIERWLKSKFREGCSMMKTSFQKHDPQRAGLVCSHMSWATSLFIKAIPYVAKDYLLAP